MRLQEASHCLANLKLPIDGCFRQRKSSLSPVDSSLLGRCCLGFHWILLKVLPGFSLAFPSISFSRLISRATSCVCKEKNSFRLKLFNILVCADHTLGFHWVADENPNISMCFDHPEKTESQLTMRPITVPISKLQSCVCQSMTASRWLRFGDY